MMLLLASYPQRDMFATHDFCFIIYLPCSVTSYDLILVGYVTKTHVCILLQTCILLLCLARYFFFFFFFSSPEPKVQGKLL